MKNLKKITSIDEAVQQDYIVIYNIEGTNTTLIKTNEAKTYPIKISANGDGYIIVNKGEGLGSAIITAGEETITLSKLPSNQDMEMDGVMYYAYDFMGQVTAYFTQSEEGTYENVSMYANIGGWEEIPVDSLEIKKAKEGGSKEQYLYYTEGDNQFLYADTPILSVETDVNLETQQNNETLTAIDIPDSVTSIGAAAFGACTSLTSVTIPDSVTSISANAFESCSGLTSVTIGNSVTSIGSVAFYGCSSLTSIDIPNSVTSIGSAAFWGCM